MRAHDVVEDQPRTNQLPESDPSRVYFTADYDDKGERITLNRSIGFFRKYKPYYITQLLPHPIEAGQGNDAPALIAYFDPKEPEHKLVIQHYNGELKCKLYGHSAPVTAAKRLSEKTLVTGDQNGVVFVWDISPLPGENSDNPRRKTGKKTHQAHKEIRKQHFRKQFQAHEGKITAIEAVDPETYVTVSSDGTFKYWRVDQNECLRTVEVKKPILALTVLSPEEVIYVTKQDKIPDPRTVLVHSFDVSYCNRERSPPIHKTFFSPDYPCLLEKDILQVRVLLNGGLYILSYSPDSRLVTVINKVFLRTPLLLPASLLENGRYAFWRPNDNSVVVTEYPMKEAFGLSTLSILGEQEVEEGDQEDLTLPAPKQ